MSRIATMFAILIIGLIAGPAVSLYGSPTVSPVTAAAWASEPLPPYSPSSISFFALSQAPPPAVIAIARNSPVTIVPISRPPSIFTLIRPTTIGIRIGTMAGRILERIAGRVTRGVAGACRRGERGRADRVALGDGLRRVADCIERIGDGAHLGRQDGHRGDPAGVVRERA